MDDWPVIAENPKLDSAQYISDYFSGGVWKNTDIGSEQDTFLYRPVFLLTLYIGKQLFGNSPFGFHALNLTLHFINTVLVFFLIIRLSKTKSRLLALFASLFFALHPIHAESVSWIAGITDPLVSCFVLSSFLLYLKFRATPNRIFLILSLVFFVLALLSKENAVMLPFVMIAYATFLGQEQGQGVNHKPSLTHIGLFFIVLIIYFIVRKIILGSTIALSDFSMTGVFHLFSFVGEYIKLLFIPWPLNYYYAVPENGILQIWGAIFTLTVLATLVFFVAKRQFKDKIVLFSVCWIGLILLPSLSLAFHAEPNFSIRYLYLPSAGLSFMLPYLIESLFVRYKKATVISCSGILLVFSILTIYANRIWQNEFVFYSHAMAVTPLQAGPVSGLATYFRRNKQDQKAIEYYLKASELGDTLDKVNAFENIGLIYGLKGNVEQSTTFYTKAYNLAPNRSTVLVGLGNNAWSRKDYQATRSFYEKAFQADKNNYEAAYNLSILYRSLGDMNKAAYYQREALNLKR
ncbi:MAG: hypothetical protein GXP19_04310 [Gammaproteobacteria bacterium]|nr:hypothetical protein [Gammaproteobacteria bacterium]